MLEYLITRLYRLGFAIHKHLPVVAAKIPRNVGDLLITITLVALAFSLRLVIAPLDTGLPYMTFFPAVTLAAIAAGLEAGLLAMILSLIIVNTLLTPPYFSFALQNLHTNAWPNLVFLLNGLIASFAIEAMHHYRRQFVKELNTSTKTHAALKESSQCISKIFDNLYTYIALLDTNGVIQEVNKAALERNCCRKQELIGRHFYDYPWWTYDNKVHAQIIAALNAAKQGESLRFDVPVKIGAELVPVDIHISPVRDDNGKVTGILTTALDISLRKKAEEEVRILAYYDTLTKLANRRLFMDRLKLALASSNRSKSFGAVLFLDLDKFKKINDLHGHDHGDLLLIEVAERIKCCVREVDTVARFGGDEFVVLLEDLDKTSAGASRKAGAIAEKIRVSLDQPFQINGHIHFSSPSLGVCMFCGQTTWSDDLIKHADIAMYRAKNLGGNAIRFYDPVMQHSVEIRLSLETDLRNALSGQQLQLFYQIQSIHSNHGPTAEALLRWKHPEFGVLLPDKFLSIAEESCLILDIGNWVVQTACRQLAEWEQNPATRGIELSVNISSQQFMMHNFVESITAAISQYKVDPAHLRLELNEKALFTDLDDGLAKLKALKQLGVNLSLDDFGAGSSSLVQLQKLPFDQVKIDPSLMPHLLTNLKDAMLVKTIIDMARNFSLEVIAVGVETPAQSHFLQRNGCKIFQGNMFGKPLPIEQFNAELLQGLETESNVTFG